MRVKYLTFHAPFLLFSAQHCFPSVAYQKCSFLGEPQQMSESICSAHHTKPGLPAVPPATGIPAEVHESTSQKGDNTTNTAALDYKPKPSPFSMVAPLNLRLVQMCDSLLCKRFSTQTKPNKHTNTYFQIVYICDWMNAFLFLFLNAHGFIYIYIYYIIEFYVSLKLYNNKEFWIQLHWHSSPAHFWIIKAQTAMIGDTIESENPILYLCFFPWVLSWSSFHWGPRGRRESRPRASPEFAPGYTALLSTAPACNNPHLHRQSALQAPRGVPAVPGGSRSGAALLSWPRGRGGLSPAKSPDDVSRGACCCGAASHQLLLFLLPSHTESSESSRTAPRHLRKQRQRSQRVHGRHSPGKMQRSRVKL